LAELHALRRKRRERRGATGTARLEAAQADLSGRLVAAAENISKAYGDHLVVRNFSVRVMRGDRVGIVGPNGAGKTTLLNLLSGGERARLTLARAFARPCNLLVLDEPTNDLDLETLDLLQEQLAEYPGTVLLVSHDRDFLDRVVTSTIAADGNGRWVEYAGGYTD